MENQLLDNELISNEVNLEVKWAGFWIRVGASFIDFFVYLPLVGVNMYNLYMLKSLPLQLLITLTMIFYKPFMEFRYGATLGKMAVKLKVVNKDYNKISLLQAILRFSPWLLGQLFSIYSTILLFQNPGFIDTNSWTEVGTLQNQIISPIYSSLCSFVMIISCVVVGFSNTKQGLHDMIAGTYCIYKDK